MDNFPQPVESFERSSMTLRGSLRHKLKDDFNFASSFQDYVLSQMGLHVGWETNDHLTFFVQGQDARVVRESKTAGSGSKRRRRRQHLCR